jgi:anti-sigma factor RsiW
MDGAALEGAEEALFADIMASSSGSGEPQRKAKVEKREKRRDTKQRPVSMSTFSPSSAFVKTAAASRAGRLARGFPFSKRKACSVQHLPGQVENYNKSHDQLYQVKALAASQVRLS